MTKYRIKEQENNRTEGIPTVLVALRAQIEATRLFLDSVYDPTEKEEILKEIEDLKIQRDNLVDTIKKARLNNLRAQNAVLLNELNNEKYFSNLEERLTIKPIEVSKLSFVIKPIRKRRAKLIPNKISFTKE
jgi:hypothetical protein